MQRLRVRRATCTYSLIYDRTPRESDIGYVNASSRYVHRLLYRILIIFVRYILQQGDHRTSLFPVETLNGTRLSSRLWKMVPLLSRYFHTIKWSINNKYTTSRFQSYWNVFSFKILSTRNSLAFPHFFFIYISHNCYFYYFVNGLKTWLGSKMGQASRLGALLNIHRAIEIHFYDDNW